METGFGKKADYMNFLKDYMKRVVGYLESNNKADQVEGFKKNINGVMKGLLGRFNDLQFFTGIYTRFQNTSLHLLVIIVRMVTDICYCQFQESPWTPKV